MCQARQRHLSFLLEMLRCGHRLLLQRQSTFTAAVVGQRRSLACGDGNEKKSFSSINNHEASHHPPEIDAVLKLQPKVLTCANVKPTVETRTVRNLASTVSLNVCLLNHLGNKSGKQCKPKRG